MYNNFIYQISSKIHVILFSYPSNTRTHVHTHHVPKRKSTVDPWNGGSLVNHESEYTPDSIVSKHKCCGKSTPEERGRLFPNLTKDVFVMEICSSDSNNLQIVNWFCSRSSLVSQFSSLIFHMSNVIVLVTFPHWPRKAYLTHVQLNNAALDSDC